MKRHRNRSLSPTRHMPGFTLVELLLALTITAMIGGGVSAMLFSVSYGTTSESDIRRVTVKERVIALRMDAAIRSSRMILDQGADYLVLWMGDSRDNGVPDLSEIRRIERNSATSELWSYTAIPALPDADNTQYTFITDFNTVTQALAGTANFPGQQWAGNVTAWGQTLDQANPQTATMLAYSITCSGNNVTSTVSSTLSLRGR